MRAGQLRHPIIIQEVVETRDAVGGITKTWDTWHQVRATITPLSSGEQIRAAQFGGETTHTVRIRYIDGLDLQHRILFGDRIFEITGIINFEERNRELLVSCKEKI